VIVVPWYIVSDGDFDQFEDRTPANACMVNAWCPANAVSSAADIMQVKQGNRLHVRLATKVLYVGVVHVMPNVSGDIKRANKNHKIQTNLEGVDWWKE
jgi:hypothetical protein